MFSFLEKTKFIFSKCLICFFRFRLNIFTSKISNLLLPLGAMSVNIPILFSSFSFVFLLSLQILLVVTTTDNFCSPKSVYQLFSWHHIIESMTSFSVHFLSAIFFIILMEINIFVYLFLLFKLLLMEIN